MFVLCVSEGQTLERRFVHSFGVVATMFLTAAEGGGKVLVYKSGAVGIELFCVWSILFAERRAGEGVTRQRWANRQVHN